MLTEAYQGFTSDVVMRIIHQILSGFLGLGLILPAPVLAATDEIQVYDGEIVKPGAFGLTVHNNYTFKSLTTPDYPGGTIDHHSLNGVPEFAYGLKDWWELGLYAPVYTIDKSGSAHLDSVKLRSLFVRPNAAEQTFFYGLNFELSYNAKRWEPTQFSGEMRPIIGMRLGKVDLIFNPILDTDFRGGIAHLTFAPAERIAYNFSDDFALALEHYADFGALSHFEPAAGQSQSLFAVADTKIGSASVDFGIGRGFTAASDRWVAKLIVSFDL